MVIFFISSILLKHTVDMIELNTKNYFNLNSSKLPNRLSHISGFSLYLCQPHRTMALIYSKLPTCEQFHSAY